MNPSLACLVGLWAYLRQAGFAVALLRSLSSNPASLRGFYPEPRSGLVQIPTTSRFLPGYAGTLLMPEPSLSFTTNRATNDRERRAWVRLGSGQEVCCLPAGSITTDESEAAWLAIVQDVSPCGIGLTMRKRFDPGSLLIIELAATPDEVTRDLPVRVVHAAQESRGYWIIGCAFASPLSQEELQKFIAE